MEIIKEFKEFAIKGNMLDLAIGIVIGAAFNKIVNSFVTEIITPVIGLFTGKVDLANRFVDLSGKGFATVAEAKAAGAPIITYGAFLNAIIEFVIVAFVLFIIVKQVNRLRRLREVQCDLKK